MVDANAAHNLICVNILSSFHGHLQGGPSQAFMADMKVRVQIAADEYFYYPDVLVSCRADDRATHYREHPTILIEVVSESTERLDSRENLLAYQRIPSRQEYVMVARQTRELTIFRSVANWMAGRIVETEELNLHSLSFRMTIDDMRAGI